MGLRIYVSGQEMPAKEAKEVWQMAAFRAGIGCYDTINDIWARATETDTEETVERWDPEEARDKVFEVTNCTMEIDIT